MAESVDLSRPSSERWIDFLRSEREGTRRTVSLFGTFFAALLASSLTAAFALRQQQTPVDLTILFFSAFSWAVSGLVTLAYMWSQYQGALKSISRWYANPVVAPGVAPITEEVLKADYWELTIRDPGYLLEVLLSSRRRAALAKILGEPTLNPHLGRLGRGLVRALGASALAYLSALLVLAHLVPSWFAVALFAIATLFVTALWVTTRRYVRALGYLFQSRRDRAQAPRLEE